jgi:asparagine synthase (glutamine-hydrolysing)
MSMANSLEARTPFLDYRLVEFAAGLPSHLKLKGLQTKYLLKKCMSSRLPASILKRKKEGFSIPMKNWLRRELRPLMQDLLSPTRLKRGGFFSPSYVEKLMTEHVTGVANHGHQLWSLMTFEIWRDSYLN